MSTETGRQAWLYEHGHWKLTTDPIGTDSDVAADYERAGYSELPDGATPFLSFGFHSEDITPAVQLQLFVRHEHPQCMIEIEGSSGSLRNVFAATLPDGLDLVARWASLATAGILTALAKDLAQRVDEHPDYQGRPGPRGMIESIARRLVKVLPY
jgi:hypothetical protein